MTTKQAAHRGPYAQPGQTVLVQIPLEELQREKTKWEHRLTVATQDVSRLERDSFAATVQARIEPHRQALAEARTSRNEASAVLDEISRQLPAAKLGDYGRQSAALRAEIESDQGELDRLRSEIDEHLQAIERLEGVKYQMPATGFAGSGEARSQALARRILKKKMRLEDLEARRLVLESKLQPAGGNGHG